MSSKSPLLSPLRLVLRWIDNKQVGTAQIPEEQLGRIDFARVIPFILVHAFCLGVIWWGWSWVAVGVCAAMYAIRMVAITGFYHRYFSHRTFKTSRFFQFIFAVLGNSSAQRGPLWWAAHHRHHHRHSDTEKDVHSPITHSLMWSHMLWITTRENFGTKENEVRDLLKFPELRFLDRFDVVVPFLTGALMFFLGVGLNTLWPGLGTNGMQMLTWGFFISTVLLFHGTCTINSLSHLMGRQRYVTGDHSRNSLILAFVTFGEGWHNNHHYYPASTRQGFYWYEIDITYYVLRVMSCFGIIWDLKPVPEAVREKVMSHDAPANSVPAGGLPKGL